MIKNGTYDAIMIKINTSFLKFKNDVLICKYSLITSLFPQWDLQAEETGQYLPHHRS